MRREKQRRVAAAACFLLSALLLFLTLAAQIRLRAVQSEIGALQSEIEALGREGSILSVRLAGRTSLAELERRAEELGMGRRRPDQTVELGIDEKDETYR